MAEAIRFAVVCGCGGAIKPVAYLDDERPIGRALRVNAKEGKMIVIAPEMRGEEPWDRPDETAAMFTRYNVTRVNWNRWGNPRITWVIRCADCSGPQAQMSHATYELVADELASTIEKWPVMPVPAAHDPDATEERRLIPLGV
jgi:hypothetical protein